MIVSDYILPAVIALILFNLGLSLTFKDFDVIIKQPGPLITGLICQIVLLPAIAFVIAIMAPLPPLIKAGIVLIAACPGGATSNLITYLLKGNVALSISLTSINSIVILVTIPLIMFLSLKFFSDGSSIINLPVGNTIGKIFVMIILPTLAGLYMRKRHRGWAEKTEKWMKYFTTALLAIVYAIAAFGSKSSSGMSFDIYLKVTPYVFALNVLGMSMGFLIGKILGYRIENLITLSIEIGIQNSALAITLATSQLFIGQPIMAIPALVYGLFTFFNAVIFGFIVRKWAINARARSIFGNKQL